MRQRSAAPHTIRYSCAAPRRLRCHQPRGRPRPVPSWRATTLAAATRRSSPQRPYCYSCIVAHTHRERGTCVRLQWRSACERVPRRSANVAGLPFIGCPLSSFRTVCSQNVAPQPALPQAVLPELVPLKRSSPQARAYARRRAQWLYYLLSSI